MPALDLGDCLKVALMPMEVCVRAGFMCEVAVELKVFKGAKSAASES